MGSRAGGKGRERAFRKRDVKRRDRDKGKG